MLQYPNADDDSDDRKERKRDDYKETREGDDDRSPLRGWYGTVLIYVTVYHLKGNSNGNPQSRLAESPAAKRTQQVNGIPSNIVHQI